MGAEAGTETALAEVQGDDTEKPAPLVATRNEGTGRPRTPNILWLVSEDNNPFVGAYGDPHGRPPMIDRLAREGILYRNDYSTAPVCAPTRFSGCAGPRRRAPEREAENRDTAHYAASDEVTHGDPPAELCPYPV